MNVKSYLIESKNAVDRALEKALSTVRISKNLAKAMEYSVSAGGKRVRPALIFAGCDAVGGNWSEVLPAAVAVEMIHTYSLIHDDLPAMDNDDLRRGKPTNHKIFGDALAILAGDALLTHAFTVLADPTWDIPADRKIDVIGILAEGAGSEGMVGGQVLDLEYEGKPYDEAALNAIHLNKTGKLLRASVLAGARGAGADKEQLNQLDLYAKTMGLSFQIADDILDVTATTEELGKDSGSDLKRKKATYPALFGLEESRKRAKALLSEALSALQPLGPKTETLAQLATFIVERKS